MNKLRKSQDKIKLYNVNRLQSSLYMSFGVLTLNLSEQKKLRKVQKSSGYPRLHKGWLSIFHR